jgi:hypothetical protein
MSQTQTTTKPGIRVVLHMAPATYVAGIMCAQRRGLKHSEFVDGAVAAACAEDGVGADGALPWSTHSMDLFLQLADTLPEALRGHWKVLYAKVLEEPELWVRPHTTVGDHESGDFSPDWHINHAALRKAWPRLVSSVFLC